MAYSTADRLAYLKETKTAIRQAINAQGGTLTEATPFRDYADAISSLSTGSGGGTGGGSLQMAHITRATNATFDISNYVADGDMFILLFSVGRTTYAKGMLVGQAIPSGTPLYSTTNNTGSSNGILTLGGDATGSTSSTGFLVKNTSPIINYSEGIITVADSLYSFGTNAILFYVG